MSRSTSTYHGDDRSDQHTEHPEKASDSPTESHEHTFQDKDVERAASHEEPTDPNLVDWDTDDPENPLNWPTKKTWCNLGIVSFLRFLTPLASSMIAPVVSLVLRDLHTGNKTIGSLVVSIYILGYAIGPMVIAPLSEIYGRLPVYHVNNVLFFVWNLASALAPNIGALLAFRLLAGLAGSCPVAIGSGSVADCVPKEKRGMAMAIMTAGPLMGPVLGPIAGGFLGEDAGWRWIFWVITIASGACGVVSFILQQESYAPVLLERRTRERQKQTGNPSLYHKYSNNLTKSEIFWRAIARPLTMLFTSPIVFLTSVYVGLVYGYTYLLFTSFERAFQTIYAFPTQIIGLTYLGFGIGCATGLVIVGVASDRMVAHYSKGTEWKAEYRLIPLLPGSLLVPLGLFWYGWSAEAKTHWIVPIIGTAWVGLGTLAVFMPIQSYLIDAFPLFAASASAANTIFRSLLGAFVPLAGPSLYGALGQGWGNSLLAFVALAFTPLAWIIFRYGERIRTNHPGRVK